MLTWVRGAFHAEGFDVNAVNRTLASVALESLRPTQSQEHQALQLFGGLVVSDSNGKRALKQPGETRENVSRLRLR